MDSRCLTLCLLAMIGAVYPEIKETCNDEDFTYSCEPGQVILMTSAEYGRREMGRCINKEEPHMGCWTDVLLLLDMWCSGRGSCEFKFPNPLLRKANQESDNACPDYLMMYLKVHIECITVKSSCERHMNIIEEEEGVLSSHVTEQTGCGSSMSPWKISVSQGKTINLTLFDFAGDSQSQGQNYVTCKYIYGHIIERSLGINHTICGGQGRQRALYSSKTNIIEVHLRNINDGPKFIVKYTGVGCSELRRPENAWYKREGSEAVIGCETNDQEWRLTCTGNTWHGTVGNCSMRGDTADLKPEEGTADVSFEVGFSSMIVMTSIACGVVVAVVIAVMCGIIYIKKYRMKQETKRIQTTYATMEKHQAYYRPVNDNSSNCNPPATDAPSERLVDVPGTWVHSDTIGRQGTMTSYPDQCMCPTLPGARA